ncbi:MAG TPA: nucleotide exchange factor GrpE [Candidatus Cloacimonadota bacterium]|nr:nucleotide exchange factor GrpE [Candidatus Cloacimonadota bacterium]HOH78958.1 nucleotide exchange factor GrpE [Candidatus Cloacimonadota bacterium]
MSRKKRHGDDHKPEAGVTPERQIETEQEEMEIKIEDSGPVREAKLEQEVAEWKDKYLRNMAEFENFRKRSNQEKADWIKLATQKLALDICDVLDNFERALAQTGEEHKEDKLIKGFAMIEQQLRTVLERENIRKIDALGKDFDPQWHEALAHIPSDYDENIVAAVIQNGYMIHDKVLRPARVAVSSGPLKAEPEEQDIEQE